MANQLSEEAVWAEKNPPETERSYESDSKFFVASQWQLIWWRFRKHKLAMVGGAITLLIYLVAIFAEFLAPFSLERYDPSMTYAPPQRLYLLDTTSGSTRLNLHVKGWVSMLDTEEMRRKYYMDPNDVIPMRFFVRGDSYKLWGVIQGNLHLFGPVDSDRPVYMWGGDRLGRDLISRLIYGTRISMSIGLVGVLLSLLLGILLGGLSGYLGGYFDIFIQRIIEFIRSVPTIPLWMGLAAAIPPAWPPERVYFGITVILSLVGWTGLARVVRGRFLSLKSEDFVMMAELDGASTLRVIFLYLLPSFMSHIIASITISIPSMIISETALSFLGLGLREPVVSWGVLLQAAQTVRVVITAPWLMIPALAVIITVLAMNFLGDGLRDAADPYAH